MKKLTLIAVAMVLLCPALMAQNKSGIGDGSHLLKQCRKLVQYKEATGTTLADTDFIGVTYCAAYLGGFLDGHMMTHLLNEQPPAFCSPFDGIGGEQGARIVVKWLNDHPEKLHLDNGLVVMMAMQDAFPCPVAPETPES